MKTVLETITSGAGFLEKKGVEDGRLSMEHLLAKVLGCERLELYMQFDRPLTEPELVDLRALTLRRAAREPLQYLLGDAEFHGRLFKVDPSVLIPRPETEDLVLILLECYEDEAPATVLDLGTGSGAIGLTLALEWPEAQVALGDVSAHALVVARENATSLEVADDRIEFVETNLLSALQGRTFDLIVANLPYVAGEDMAGLQAEVLQEPRLALDGGPGGRALMENLLLAARSALNPGGLIALEHGLNQSEKLLAYAASVGLEDGEAIADSFEIPRFLLARAPGD